MKKRILAFVLAAAMVLGDAAPVMAAGLQESTGQGTEISGENSDWGGAILGSEEEPDAGAETEEQAPVNPGGETKPSTEETPGTPEAPEEVQDPEQPEDSETPEDTETSEDTEAPEDVAASEDAADEMFAPDAEEELLQEMEMDGSEYILQAGGSGILPETEDDGIALFAAQRVEDVIAAGLKNRAASINISSFGLTAEGLYTVYVNVLNENPSLFYVNNEWSYSLSGGKVYAVKPQYLSEYDESATARYEAAVNKALEESINDQMDDVEKALALHDYLVLHCAYENDGAEPLTKYNAYNAMVDGEAVCQGYTLAYTALLQRAGVPVSYATSDAMNHIWNLVQLGDNWYHVDTTWDDPTPDCVGRVGHSNFLRSDEGITKTEHHDWVTGIEGTTCEDDSYASGQFWNGVSTAVFYEGNTCYYMSADGKLMERSQTDGEEELYALKDIQWPVWGGGGIWMGMYTGLSRSGDYLYCNDKTSVYRIFLPFPKKADIVYTYDQGDGYIYGSCAVGNEMWLSIGQNPNKSFTKKKIDLPEPPEESYGPENPVHTWNTLDGGTADSSAPEEGRVKLLVFAPQWAYNCMSSFYHNPLFRDNKYIDVVILDTQGQDAEEIRKNLPIGDMNNYPNAPVSYCYYNGTDTAENPNPILQAYREYRALTGMEEYTEEIGRQQAACFLINSENMVVYSDSQACKSVNVLVDNLMTAINKKKYLRSEISTSVDFRKDGAGRVKFEWDKTAGVRRCVVYSDPEETNIRNRTCQGLSSTFGDPEDPDETNRDEGYAWCSLKNEEGRLNWHQVVLFDEYGLQVAASKIVRPQDDVGANPEYKWTTTDGKSISSKNSGKKMKAVVFLSMTNQSDKIRTFFEQPLFRAKDYMDVVILDTSRMSKASLKAKKEQVEKYNYISGSSYVLSYCYDTSADGVKKVFEGYCSQVGVTEAYDPEKVAYFLIDQNNQIVGYYVWEVDSSYCQVGYDIVRVIEENNYIQSNIAAPSVQIKANKVGRIEIGWEKISGAGGYKVYRSETGEENDWEEVADCPVDSSQHVNTWTDENVKIQAGDLNCTYYYKVKARDQYWLYGKFSDVVTNKDLDTEYDPLRFKALHLVDEEGNEVTSLDLREGETKRVYQELERYNGERVRISYVKYGTWEIYTQTGEPQEENGSIDLNAYMPDETDAYAAWWYEELTNQNSVNVTGMQAAADAEKRFLFCEASGSVEGYSYSLRVMIPIQVEEAETEIPDVDMTPGDSYTERDVLNQYVRDQLTNRAAQIRFCVPGEVWEEWNQEKPWTFFRDAVDFYEDHPGMKSWEGDYLFFSLKRFTHSQEGEYCYYKGDSYYTYTIACEYYDDVSKEQKVNEKLNALIWEPDGALYPCHDATEYEIVKACMDWIGKNVKYIGTPDANYHSAYSALFNGKATCEGYSLLLYRMLREFGISNRILMGMDENAHTYNIVELDGAYYYTDPSSGALLRGSNTFKHAEWQERFFEDEFTEKVASRISKTDYVYIPRYVRLYRLTDESGTRQVVGNYKTLSEAREQMKAAGTGSYRIDLQGGVSVTAGNELEALDGITYALNLNGYTLTIPYFNENFAIQASLYGGDKGTGAVKVQKNQNLTLAPAGDAKGRLEIENVKITGDPKLTLGKNVTLDAASGITAGELNIPQASEHVVLDGTVTAGTFKYGAADTMVRSLTVSGQTTVNGGSTLLVKGSAVFNQVKVEAAAAGDGIFHLNLVKTLSADGETLGTGTATFKGKLEKAADRDYAVLLERLRMTEGSTALESDPFMPEDTLVTITGKEAVIPTRYFRIPEEDPYGRKLSPVREGNVLKVKGVVVEVSLEGRSGSQKYISVEDAVNGIKNDFGSQKGTYRFTFLGNAVLTKNLTLPACVEHLELKTAQKEITQENEAVQENETVQGQVFASLDFKGFTLNTAGRVTLYEGLQLNSSGKQAKLNLTGTYGDEAAFQVEPAPENVVWTDALGQPFAKKPESRRLALGVEIAAAKGAVVLNAPLGAPEDDNPYSQAFHLQHITARDLYIESGTWTLQNAAVSGKYQVAQNTRVFQTNVTLTKAAAQIDGLSEADNLFTLSQTRMQIGETGTLGGMLVINSAFGKESDANGYTLENCGRLELYSLEMKDGTLYNENIVRISEVKNIKNLVNQGDHALFMAKNLIQSNKGQTRLTRGSVLAVGEKAVLYNLELGGAYFYQKEGCGTALEGKVTLAAGLPESIPGLTFVQSAPEDFAGLWPDADPDIFENWDREAYKNTTAEAFIQTKLPAGHIEPQTCLFTTKIASFPSSYIAVRQADPDSEYTSVYQIGQNIRVGKEWIVISARRMDGEEEGLAGFILWSDAMNYLSKLSNPNMTYIVDILEDVDIEQGLTMPGKAAGLVIRGADVKEGEAKTILTYTGDLNLTIPLEFCRIELKAKKNNGDYESTVKLNGNRITFSKGARAVFSSLKGTAASVLEINDDSRVEVHGEVNVGQLWSDRNDKNATSCLIGLATVKRDKEQNITALTPQITVNGQTDIRNGRVQISLKEKVTKNKETSYSDIDFIAGEAAQIRMNGIQMAKAPYAKPGDFVGCAVRKESQTIGGITMSRYVFGTMSKKGGYLVCFEELDEGINLVYGTGSDEVVIPFKTFADAVAEINNLKTKQAYTIQIEMKAGELFKESPTALTMPNKNYVSSLCIEAVEVAEGSQAELYYLNGLTLTSDTVLKNIALKQMVKSGNVYVPADEVSDYPPPVSLKTGGFDLTIAGKVTFNTPLNLEGGNTGILKIEPDASLVTVTNEIAAENEASDDMQDAVSVIAGSVKKFKTFDVPAGQEIRIVQWGGALNKDGSRKYTAAELNVTGMTIGGSVALEGGNAVVKDLILNDGILKAAGANAGKVTLTNVTLKGSVRSEIWADRDFTISGTLDNQTENARFSTRQKPEKKGVVQMPYLNITGKVTAVDGYRIAVCVRPNDCAKEEPVILSDAPKASGQLLTAKTAAVEYFAVAPSNLGEESEDGAGGLYSPENPDGYMLVKSGANIYVYGAEQVAVALCKGDVSDGDWSKAEILNYYPGWAEAVAAVNALNQTKETYTLLLLKDAGAQTAPLNLTLPAKADTVYVASVQNGGSGSGAKRIYYRNALSLGSNTEFSNVILHPVTAKGVDTSLGISIGNFDLALRDVQMGGVKNGQTLKDITGKGKGNVVLDSRDLTLLGGISGVKSLTVQKKTTVFGAVKTDALILAGNVNFTTQGAVTVTDITSKGKGNILKFERTNKDYSNLTVNGAIINEGEGRLILNMQIPYTAPLIREESDYWLTVAELKNQTGWKTALSDTKKLAVMPKVSTSDFEFWMAGSPVSDRVVKANKGLYLLDGTGYGLAQYTIELETVGKEGRVRCLDLTQAVNEINTLSDGTKDYILHLPDVYADTNCTDDKPCSPLILPGTGKAASVTLSGRQEGAAEGEENISYLSFTGNISMSGNLILEGLLLNPMKANSNTEGADFSISVTGKTGVSLTLDDVTTWADRNYWKDQGLEYETTGFISQITGTKNVTNVIIKNSNLRLKTGLSNVNRLTLDTAQMITCKTSALNDLSMTGSSWDALGATTITNIIGFDADSYLAGKQDSRKYLSQLTVNGKAEDPVKMKVIQASNVLTKIDYVESYKDVTLLKAPKEAAGTFEALWPENKPQNQAAQNNWVEPEERIYYKDTSNYVLCGDRNEMAVWLTGIGGDGKELAGTYTKSWNDAVTLINGLNDSAASYTLELLQNEMFTGKNGTFGGMTFPSNNKAKSLTVCGSGDAYPVITFSGNLTTYGNVTLEQVAFRAIKDLKKEEAAAFNINADGNKNASSLTLRNIQIDGRGGALKDISGKSKASVILESEGLLLSGGISATPNLVVKKDVAVKGAVKTDLLTLQADGNQPVTFTAEGAVAVMDVENKGGQNTIVYGRTAKNVTNLAINGKIINEKNADGTNVSPLRLNMQIPAGKSQKNYELELENLKTTGKKTVLNNDKKLADMPKASTSDFVFCIGGVLLSDLGEGGKTPEAVKANKGLYLAGSDAAERAVELKAEKDHALETSAVMETDITLCLDLTQAVNEINNRADKNQKVHYTLYLPETYTDTNLTDGNPYGTFAMPKKDAAASLTVSGRREGEAGDTDSTVTFTGNISANGTLTLEHLVLDPVKKAADGTPADFNISAAGNAKTGGATLTLDDVRTKADGSWNWTEQKLTTPNQSETTGFIGQISGTKNVTNVMIKDSNLRLKTGVSNVDTLTLENARLITCKTSAFNNLSISDSTWDTLGAATIADITKFEGNESYLAGKQDSRKYLPQLTVNSSVTADAVNLKLIGASNLLTEIQYVEDIQDRELVKASKAGADRFRVRNENPDVEMVSYKDTAGYVRRGSAADMEVKILDSGNRATYAKCWQDAVTIINNVNAPKECYIMELLREEIRTGKEGTAYAGLTLPSKTAGVTVKGQESQDETAKTVLTYTGALKPGCAVTFENLVLNEGTAKKDVFTPSYQTTLNLGNVNAAFENVSTMKNPKAGSEESKADLVLASASASKGVLTLRNETVYTKGNFAVPNLHVAGDVVLISEKAMTLTDITGEDAGNSGKGTPASLVLDARMTAIAKAGQQSVTQISIKGKIENTEVGIAPQTYDLSRTSYHRLTAYEARALLAAEAKPDAGKKLANVSKTFADTGNVRLLYSYENGWSAVERGGEVNTDLNFYVYNSGLYMK